MTDVLVLPGPEVESPQGRTKLEGHSEDHDHHVPEELLELHEILEVGGLRDLPLLSPWQKENLLLSMPPPGTVVGRSTWGARQARGRTSIANPKGSSAHWQGVTTGVPAHSSCPARVRGIQNFHMDANGWVDIAYNAIVCPHGVIYQGRWWGIRSAANGTNAGNGSDYAVCLLGGPGDPFTVAAQRGLEVAYGLARSQGGAGSGRRVHHDWKATQCPGSIITQFVRRMGAVLPAPPTPIVNFPQVEDSMFVIYGPKWYHLSNGKLVWISTPPEGPVTIYRPNDAGWRTLTRAHEIIE